MSTGFSRSGFPTVEHRVPGSHLSRLGQSLYAHVCDSEYGRQRTEPQKCGPEQELDFEAILLKQRTSHAQLYGIVAVLTNRLTESPLYFLRHERNLLHRSLPPLFFFAVALADSPRRSSSTIFDPTWLARSAKTFDVLH